VEFATMLPVWALRHDLQKAAADRGPFDQAAKRLKDAGDAFLDLARKMEHAAGREFADLAPVSRSPAVAAFNEALQATGSLLVDRTIVAQIYWRRGAIDAVVSGGRTTSSGAVLTLGQELLEAGSMVEYFGQLQGEAPRAYRKGGDGRLPDVAARDLNTWALVNDIGPLALARALVAAGLLDSESWEPDSIAQALVPQATRAWEKWIKNWRQVHAGRKNGHRIAKSSRRPTKHSVQKKKRARV
jgi:hypothetical protein